MTVAVGVLGVALVLLAFADLMNTLVTTSTSLARGWPSQLLTRVSYRLIRFVAVRLGEGSTARERLLATFAPLLLLELLTMWVLLQLVGFGLIWWAMAGLPAVQGVDDAIYYSGIVFFTVGFGEIVPEAVIPRIGALVEAFLGLVTVALVVGYLPSLYAAYSSREQALMRLDDGTGNRISPTNLVMAWSPDADPKKLEARFSEWEAWAASILETHSTLPLLRFFRSHEPKQHWVTALGLLADAALHTQIVLGAYDGQAYWFMRRAVGVFDELTRDVPQEKLAPYYEAAMASRAAVEAGEGRDFFRELYDALDEHGFELVPYDIAREYAAEIRLSFGPKMEFLIDELLAPRGFWCPAEVRIPLLSTAHPEMLSYQPDRD
ncbi:MAG: hypothetical protein ACJA2F_000964 [Nitriliruptoraceae bacterium]|jgi:hypothetical protein